MCGIVGLVGRFGAEAPLLDRLEVLEYRGYDSAGAAWFNAAGELSLRRALGPVAKLRERIGDAWQDQDASARIAHTRWATHGGVVEKNAHPHIDCHARFALVHNGVIENHDQLRKDIQDDHVLRSETDSELIVHLVADSVRAGLSVEAAIAAATQRLRGSFAIVLVDAQDPDVLYVARRGSPLVIGFAPLGVVVASDQMGLGSEVDSMARFQDGDVARVQWDGFTLHPRQGSDIVPERPIVPFTQAVDTRPASDFAHFMRQEIEEQPAVVGRVLTDRLHDDRVVLPELEAYLAGQGERPERILIAACGSSLFAALANRAFLEEALQCSVDVSVASELRLQPHRFTPGTWVMAISQSGETADTLAAVKLGVERGLPLIALCNVETSTLAEMADVVIDLRAGPERSVASTKAFMAQFVALQLFGLAMGSLTSEREQQRRDALRALPDRLAKTLLFAPQVTAVAQEVTDARAFLFLGRGEGRGLAKEGALKLKEISYIPAEGLAAAEMKHGSIALIDELVPTVILASGAEGEEKLLLSIDEILARSGQVIAVACESEVRVSERATFTLPVADGDATTFGAVATVALQLFSYAFADALGRPIDRPRNLAKSVTVE